MNTRTKWTQWMSIAVLVALASIFTTGVVAADTPPVSAGMSRQARMVQYRAAVKQVEQDHDWERFVQVLANLEYSARSTARPRNSRTTEMYHAALRQVEQDHNWERFEQFVNR